MLCLDFVNMKNEYFWKSSSGKRLSNCNSVIEIVGLEWVIERKFWNISVK